MAKEKSTKSDKTNIRRIKASDDAPKKPASPKVAQKPAAKATKKTKPVRDLDAPAKNPLVRLGNYFKGAWQELKQVRWPTRSATWSMTLAVLIFSGIFVAIILLLDLGFNRMFELLLN